MHVLIAVHDFAFAGDISVLQNTMKAALSVYIYLCALYMFANMFILIYYLEM